MSKHCQLCGEVPPLRRVLSCAGNCTLRGRGDHRLPKCRCLPEYDSVHYLRQGRGAWCAEGDFCHLPAPGFAQGTLRQVLLPPSIGERRG